MCFLPGEGYLITNPRTGASCRTTLDGSLQMLEGDPSGGFVEVLPLP